MPKVVVQTIERLTIKAAAAAKTGRQRAESHNSGANSTATGPTLAKNSDLRKMASPLTRASDATDSAPSTSSLNGGRSREADASSISSGATVIMLNQPCREHGFPRIADSEEDCAPELPVAGEVSCDRCRHCAGNDRPSRRGSEGDQHAGRYARGRPENRNAFRFGQERKAELRRHEIDDADRDSEPERANPPRQVEAGGKLVRNLYGQILLHPVLLPIGSIVAHE